MSCSREVTGVLRIKMGQSVGRYRAGRCLGRRVMSCSGGDTGRRVVSSISRGEMCYTRRLLTVRGCNMNSIC